MERQLILEIAGSINMLIAGFAVEHVTGHWEYAVAVISSLAAICSAIWGKQP